MANINEMTKKQAIALAAQVNSATVKLVAMDYNWGPPISGRADSDSMNFWVKVKCEEEGKLFLQGKTVSGGWDLDIEFKKVGSYKEKNSSNKFTLYHLSMNAQYQFPEEFVIRFNTKTETEYYDNNLSENYSISPFGGWGGSVICSKKAIFDLGEIRKYDMYFPTI